MFNSDKPSVAILKSGILQKLRLQRPRQQLRQLLRLPPLHQLLHLPLPPLRQQNDYIIFHVSLIILWYSIATPYRQINILPITMTIMMITITLTKISMLETLSDSRKLVLGIGIGQVLLIKNPMAHPLIIVVLFHPISAPWRFHLYLEWRFRVQMDM